MCVSYTNPSLIGDYDYHCNLMYLLKCLQITYENLHFDLFFTKIKVTKSNYCQKICSSITNNSNKTPVLNWKGNPKNPHERNNRMMKLDNAIPLFKLQDINWIVLSKDVTNYEKQILDKYNVSYFWR